jgi:Sulfotransferase domain
VTKPRLKEAIARRPVVWARHQGLRRDDAFVVSYPRSGTTWMRFLLYEALTGRSSDFETLYKAIPYIGRQRGAPALVGDGGRLIFSHETHSIGNRRTVYIVRDPRSVVLSHYRFHKRRGEFDGTFDEFFRRFLDGRTNPFGAWDAHVNFWLESEAGRNGNVHTIKFEELRRDTAGVLQGVIEFFGGSPDPDRISQAVTNNDLEHMREKEDKAPAGDHFARTKNPEIRFVGAGAAAGWKEELDSGQVAEMESRLGPTLRRLGYQSSSRPG